MWAVTRHESKEVSCGLNMKGPAFMIQSLTSTSAGQKATERYSKKADSQFCILDYGWAPPCSPESTTTLLISYVFQSPSYVQLFATPWTATCQAFLSLTISQSLCKIMSSASVIPSSHLILWCPLLLPHSLFPSIRDFLNEFSVRIRWPKYWSFSFSLSPSKEYSDFISLKIFAVQGTVRYLHQYHTLRTSVLWCSAFFMVQFSGPTVPAHWEDRSLDY